MKKEKAGHDLRESELLDEIHRAEAEIDLYLKEREAESRKILEEAGKEVQEEQERIAREAERAFSEEYDLLVSRAREEAAQIVEEGMRLAAAESSSLEESLETVARMVAEMARGAGK